MMIAHFGLTFKLTDQIIQHEVIMGIAIGNMMLACITGNSEEYLCWLYLARAEAAHFYGPTPAFDYAIRQMAPESLIPIYWQEEN